MGDGRISIKFLGETKRQTCENEDSPTGNLEKDNEEGGRRGKKREKEGRRSIGIKANTFITKRGG